MFTTNRLITILFIMLASIGLTQDGGKGSQFFQLGFLDYPYSDGMAVSAEGTVTGTTVADNRWVAYAWTQEEGMTQLRMLPGFETEGAGYDVSDDGSVIVGEGAYSDGRNLAMVWINRKPTRIADGSDVIESRALKVSPDGSVVVGTVRTSRGESIFTWNPRSGLQLWGNPSDGGVIRISDLNGRYVSGFTYAYSGGTEAFMAVLPSWLFNSDR